jgi:hypothetical protein
MASIARLRAIRLRLHTFGRVEARTRLIFVRDDDDQR